MINVIKISGLDCANCARELEEEIEKKARVASVAVDFMAQKVTVDCDGEELANVKRICNSFEEVKVVEEQAVFGEKIKVEGLCCANCARELEEILNALDGVEACVDFMNSNITLTAADAGAREKAVYEITHFEDVKIVDGRPPKKSVFREKLYDILIIAIAAALFVPAIVLDLTGVGWESLAGKISVYALYGLAFLTAGHPVLINTVKNVAHGRIFDENFLMTVAAIGAMLLGIFAHDGFFEGVAVMILYQLGELLQSIAVGSSRSSISELMDLKAEWATVVENGVQRVISPDELKVGDIILIKAGEKAPVDCRVVSGTSSLDLKSLNGETLPKDVGEGDEILSGSINLSRALECEVVREYKNSAVAKILELVENSTAKKSKPEKFITKFAKYYTPAVCFAALAVAGIIPTVICAVRGDFLWATYSEWIYRALSFLVISCPCALVISVPLSYFGGIGRCAKFGILVKGSTCLDELSKCTIAAFDKTGTLTEGGFDVVAYSSERALRLAAAAEKFSSHAIAAAFEGIDAGFAASDVEEIAGMGVKCVVDGKTVLVGNAKLLRSEGVEFGEKDSVSTLVYVAEDGEYAGVIEIDDKLKPAAAEAVRELRAQGVEKCVMLTGDNAARAKVIADKVGLDGCFASLLPDEKLEKAESLKAEGKLLYVGDGINDAPVMTCADCAASMGKVGSDAAIEASDAVLVSDDLKLLPKARRIARGTRRIVFENIVGSLAVKFAVMGLGLGLAGFPLIVAVAADVGVMLAAVLNAMRTHLIK